jgi:uncharacterized protein
VLAVRAVLDTNVLVSALLTPGGTCAAICAHIITGLLIPVISPAIALEYADVLARPRLLPNASASAALRMLVENVAEQVSDVRVSPPLADRRDQCFADAAVHADADYLITGNTRHFAPLLALRRPQVLTPRDALGALDARVGQ